MLTSSSCCRHVQNSACSFSLRQDSDITTQGTAPVYVIEMSEDVMSSTRDVIRRRHMLLWCADSSLNHEARLRLLSHILMLVLTQLACGRPYTLQRITGTCGSGHRPNKHNLVHPPKHWNWFRGKLYPKLVLENMLLNSAIQNATKNILIQFFSGMWIYCFISTLENIRLKGREFLKTLHRPINLTETKSRTRWKARGQRRAGKCSGPLLISNARK
jgi:hypothetical protein